MNTSRSTLELSVYHVTLEYSDLTYEMRSVLAIGTAASGCGTNKNCIVSLVDPDKYITTFLVIQNEYGEVRAECLTYGRYLVNPLIEEPKDET